MQTQALDPNFDSIDLQEAPYVVKTKRYHPVVVGVGAALFSVILALVLVSGSMPEMSPEQIVAMEGYEGRQSPRHIFNLESLSTTDQKDLPRTPVTPQSAAEVKTGDRLQDRTAEVVVEAVEVDSAAAVESPAISTDSFAALLAIEIEEPKDDWALEIVEIPAAPIIVGKDAQAVAAPDVEEFDYRKLNRRTNPRKSVATSPAPDANAPDEMAVQIPQGEPATTIKVLPVLTINTDQAYMRAKPSQTSDIKLTLARGMSVTAFEQSGAWIHVGTNDGSSITGYVHQSSISTIEVY